MTRISHYDRLLIPAFSSPAKVRQAYLSLALKYHPDKNPDQDQDSIAVAFRAVKSSYDFLMDAEKKKAYDESLKKMDLPAYVPDPVIEEKYDATSITTNNFCGDFYAGKCWGMGCMKVHATTEEFWLFASTGQVTAHVVEQLERFKQIESRGSHICLEYKNSRCFDSGCKMGANMHPLIVENRGLESDEFLHFEVFAGKCVEGVYGKKWFTKMRALPATPLKQIVRFIRKRMKSLPHDQILELYTWPWYQVYSTAHETDLTLAEVDDLTEAKLCVCLPQLN